MNHYCIENHIAPIVFYPYGTEDYFAIDMIHFLSFAKEQTIIEIMYHIFILKDSQEFISDQLQLIDFQQINETLFKNYFILSNLILDTKLCIPSFIRKKYSHVKNDIICMRTSNFYNIFTVLMDRLSLCKPILAHHLKHGLYSEKDPNPKKIYHAYRKDVNSVFNS